jgi:hypothetical protein
MAKTDSFFIRAKTDFDGTTYAQSSIDLGAYVDALGKSVLRIHNITVRYGNIANIPTSAAGATSAAGFQLTTQSQGSLVDLTDKSVIASGILTVSGEAGTPPTGTCLMTESMDLAPQMWTNGYLVGVEQIYLGVDQNINFCSGSVQIVLECTVETLSSSAAMALALSQQ